MSDREHWTVESLASYHAALREADLRFQAERDRRYAEVALEREKAIKIKEEADRIALMLAEKTQAYKDEKANELREQINSERGLYATKDEIVALSARFEAANKPVVEFMASQVGRGAGGDAFRTNMAWVVALVASLIAIGSFAFRQTTAPTPQMIYVPAPPGTTLPVTPPQSVPR